MSYEWHGGKGDKPRISDREAYRNSPLWDNIGKDKKVEEKEPTTFLFLDDIRMPAQAYIHDHRTTLNQYSGIANFKWDIVRTYDEFVAWIDKNGIPDVVSFDNDLDPLKEVEKFDAMMVSGNYNSDELVQKTGIDCAKFMIDKCIKEQTPIPKYFVHSANPLARPIIKGLLEAAKPLIKH